MKILNKQSITLLIIIVLFLAILVYAWGKSGMRKFQKGYENFKTSRQRLAQLQEKRERLEKLKEREKEIEEGLRMVEIALPKEEAVSDFLVQLEAAASDTGNFLSSINFQRVLKKKKETEEIEEETILERKREVTKKEEEEEKAEITFVSFSLDLSGNLKSLLDYLGVLDSLSRFCQLSTLSIKSQEENKIGTKVEGKIYYKPKR